MFTEVMEAIRRERRMTQAKMAAKLHMSLRTYKDYVYGAREMSPSMQNQAATTLRSPHLALLVLAGFDNPFSPLVLDVDDHPARQLCVSLGELREAEESILQINPCNASKSDYGRLIDQHFDLIHLLPIAISAWCAESGQDLWDCRTFNTRKVTSRGYLRKEAAA